MGQYHYTAFDAQGKESTGTLEADSAKKARLALRERGLTALEIEDLAHATAQRSHLPAQHKMALTDLSQFTREFAALLHAGLPVCDALLAVSEQVEKRRVKNIILSVRERVVSGYGLAESLAIFPRAFPEVYRATVAAGEHSGHLDSILLHLADYIESQLAIRQKIRQAMVYPLVMCLVSIAVIVFLLVLVVPSMMSVFQDAEQNLPTLTVMLLTLSHATQHYGIVVLLALIGLGFVAKWGLKKPAIKARAHQAMLTLPIAGKSIRMVNTARFTRTLGLLCQSGLALLEGMQVAQALVTNTKIKDALHVATTQVGEGTAIHLALKKTGYFLPVCIHFIANGESGGHLEKMLIHAADYQDKKISQMIDTSLTIFEPILILSMGLVVLFIVLAVLLPMFEMTQMIA